MQKQNYFCKVCSRQFIGNKKNKVWLIYAYHRATGEIVSYVWGKRDRKNGKKIAGEIEVSGRYF